MIALFINITLNAKLLSLHNLKYVSKWNCIKLNLQPLK